MLKLAPSILSADFGNLLDDIRKIEEGGADYIHVDVMDGHFVPNLTFGPDILRGFRKALPQKMDVHIMVEDARTYADVFIDAGADVLTFHSEALEDDLDAILSLCAHIRERGVLAGVSIRPNTPVEPLLDHLAAMDVLLVMSVEPGFGGQSFMEGMLEKVKKARARIEAQGLSTRIEIDGGINAQTGALAVAAGCDTLVAGSYIFRQDIHAGIDSLLCLR